MNSNKRGVFFTDDPHERLCKKEVDNYWVWHMSFNCTFP